MKYYLFLLTSGFFFMSLAMKQEIPAKNISSITQMESLHSELTGMILSNNHNHKIILPFESMPEDSFIPSTTPTITKSPNKKGYTSTYYGPYALMYQLLHTFHSVNNQFSINFNPIDIEENQVKPQYKSNEYSFTIPRYMDIKTTPLERRECLMDGPNQCGNILLYRNNNLQLISSSDNPISLDFLRGGYSKPAGLGPIVQKITQLALSNCDDNRFVIINSPNNAILCIPTTKSMIFQEGSHLFWKKIAFINSLTLMGIDVKGELYLIFIEKRPRHPKSHFLKAYKQTIKDSTDIIFKTENFAVNTVCPWLVLLHTTDGKKNYLNLMNLKKKKGQDKKIESLIKPSIDIDNIWFNNDKFCFLDNTQTLSVYSLLLVPYYSLPE